MSFFWSLALPTPSHTITSRAGLKGAVLDSVLALKKHVFGTCLQEEFLFKVFFSHTSWHAARSKKATSK